MTKSYLQVVKQIEALKLEAEKLRKNEIAGVIERIREAIDHYGLTAADLGLGMGKAGRGPAPAAPQKRRAGKNAATEKAGKTGKGKSGATAAVVKFRDDAGNTWGGRGKRPQWLRDALNSGRQLDDFLVK